jgi:hypothetical protein
MIKGIDVNQRIEFSFSNDKDDPKTIFVFRPLTSAEMMDLASDAQGNTVKLAGSKIFEYLQLGIVEIKNYPVTDVKEALKTLPMDVITELVREMGRMNNMTEQEAKN